MAAISATMAKVNAAAYILREVHNTMPMIVDIIDIDIFGERCRCRRYDRIRSYCR